MLRALSRRALVLVALALVTSACVSADDPGVAIDAREADLVFGVKLPEDAAPTPQQVGMDPLSPPAFPEFDFDLPESSFEIPTGPRDPAASGPCPAAPPTAVPETVTEPFVTGDPREGVYQWTGQVETTENGQTDVEELPMHRRLVRGFEEIDEGRFRYETVQPLFDDDGNFLVSTWEVVTDAETVSPPNEAGPVQGVVTPPRVGEPEGGLLLTGTQVQDRDGNPVSGTQAFQPATGLMLLPLPVTSGQEFHSSAVDPRTGQTVVVDGVTHSRARVDACGELVDGWRVTGTQNVSVGGITSIIDFQLIVATQFGAFVIEEVATNRCCPVTVVTRAGQIDPDPLPEAAA